MVYLDTVEIDLRDVHIAMFRLYSVPIIVKRCVGHATQQGGECN